MMEKILFSCFLIVSVFCQNVESTTSYIQNNVNIKINLFTVNPMVEGIQIPSENRKNIVELKYLDNLNLKFLDEKKFGTKYLDLSGTKIENFQYLRKFSNLVSLNLSNTNITDKDLEYIIDTKTIKYLDLSSTQITTNGLSHVKNLVNLESLILNDLNIVDEDLQNISSLTRIHYLSIEGSQIVGYGLEKLKTLVNLQFFNFHSFIFKLEYSKNLQFLENLVYLSFDTGSRNEYFNFSSIRNLEKLQYFIIGNKIAYDRTDFLKNTNIRYLSIHNIPETKENMINLNNISYIKLTIFLSDKRVIFNQHIVYVKKEELKEISNLNSLKELTVKGNIDEYIFFRNVQNLKILHLYVEGEGEELLKEFTKNQQLKNLRLSFCHINKNIFEQIIKFPKLEKLYISPKNFILNISNVNSIKNMISLREFTLLGNTSNTFFQEIVALPNLYYLKICSISLNNEAFNTIKDTRIKFLDLSFCHNLNDEFVKKIETIKSLEYVNLRNTSITKQAVGILKRKNPKLIIDY